MPSKNLAELKERIQELENELRDPPPPPPPVSSTLSRPTPPSSSSSASSFHVVNGEETPTTVFRPKIAEMTSEVRDDNPYSRLMALKRMGIVEDYERIRTFR